MPKPEPAATAAEGVVVEVSTDRVTVTLVKPHIHRGKRYSAGDKIQVTPRQADLLTRWGVAS